MELKDSINQRDNETRILVAEINAESMANQNFYKEDPEQAKAELAEYLEEVARDVAIEANNVAKIAKRKTIKPEDIKLAIKNLE